ncbi:flagellar biosynthetic protein FliO [Cupriavidus sp. USMAA2-4]|uniref:Flagellar protein n=1 Tax=Cupriavidus malaysiensis TaxID=367825 RepID=A0ABN4TXJ0_9BURK|nr:MULTISPECIES: flagellar biosynthetic protein FliO [Cupriavidus]AOY94742.1 flagellar biosynthetic protein FliO [Cupriavidus sp. USMAA2-4]AOZ10230.1 flagellar biosynthetic protein FliO [Cupriavidus malaysiensis]
MSVSVCVRRRWRDKATPSALLLLPPAAHAFAPAASEATAHAGSGAAASLAQLGLGLFCVIALILALAWFARRSGLVRQGQAGVMRTIGSAMLGARQRLVLVEVGDTWLVLGVSPGEIRTLHTLPAQRAEAARAETTSASSFTEKLLRSMQENLKS